MTEIRETAECADCSAPIDDGADVHGHRAPCKKCGSVKRIHNVSITETLVLRDGYESKAKRPGQKKPYIEDLSIPDYSHVKGKHVHRQRVIDRDNDRYFEKVTDYETGKAIHHCEEPLSAHQGHGDAKRREKKG